MKYNLKARMSCGLFNYMLGGYYKRHMPERDWPTLRRRVKAEFRAMVGRTPGVGDAENSLSDTLMMSCYFFALPKADPQMTPELLNAIVDECIDSKLMHWHAAHERKSGELFSDAHQNRRVAEAARSKTSPYELDWEFDYIKGDGEFWCTYHECGLVKLAAREGVSEYTPCMCRMDYPMYRLQGARLERSQTLATGGRCCDFHVMREEPGA